MQQSVIQTLREYPWRHQFFCLLPLLLLLCALAACVGTGNDITLYFKEIRARHSTMTSFMRLVSDWTSMAYYLVYATLLLYGLIGKNASLVRFVLVFAVAQIVVSAILVQIAKITVGRPRPLLALAGAPYSPFTASGAFYSFPSGHTAEISGAAFPLANRYARSLLSLFLGLTIALVGFSRIYLAKHHISDVAGGLVAGVFAGLLHHHLCRREQP